jgi:hypothetical protein
MKQERRNKIMKDIRKIVENIVHDRNDIIALLAMRENVDLTNPDWGSFKPNEVAQKDALEELTNLAIYLEDEYKGLRLPEILQYCKERHTFNENWSGIWKDDALKLLGLESSSVIETLFKGVE